MGKFLRRLTRMSLTLRVICGKPGSSSAVHILLKVHPIPFDTWQFPAYPWRACAALCCPFLKRTSASAVLQTPAAAQSRRRDSVGYPDAGANAKRLSNSDAGDAVNMEMVSCSSSDIHWCGLTDEEDVEGIFKSIRELYCYGYLFGRGRLTVEQYDMMREVKNALCAT